MEGQPHPYAPTDLKIPGYAPNFLTQSTIVSVYGLSSFLSKIDRLLMCWWAFTGLTHLILEGYFVFSPEFYKDKTAHYLAEVWKEYSKGDSRYAARDAATVTVEGVTAVVEGPASLLAVCYCFRKIIQLHILQLAVSLGQLYGTAVYFLTAYLEGDHFAATSYHYYVYYIGANASWVVIPSLIALRCWNKICSAVQIQGQKRTKSH
ncbi:3-beta-hydroxysteroid-Delta(8),Delta(7)-isomerase [Salix suchowensis]|nr:3-beta-hydroxysteroid-Delta(8),Delta(7)-isomerase [Salix suchowensis]